MVSLYWILLPASLLLALSIGLNLYLYLGLKRDIAYLRHAIHQNRAATEEIRRIIPLTRQKPAPTSTPASAPVSAPPEAPATAAGTRRAQIIRMAEQGESTQRIAAAMRMSRYEVEFLLKLHHGAPERGAG